MSHSSFISPLRSTRFAGLFYAHCAASLWRFVVIDASDEHAVGPHYSTKAELMGDLERFATHYGYRWTHREEQV